MTKLPHPTSGKYADSFWFFNNKISPNYITKYIPIQGYYLMDEFQSEVIEFSRSYLMNNIFHRGRIWAEFRYIDPKTNSWVNKNPDFKKWFENISKWIKKNYFKLDPMIYIGPGAKKYLEGKRYSNEMGFSKLKIINES